MQNNQLKTQNLGNDTTVHLSFCCTVLHSLYRAEQGGVGVLLRKSNTVSFPWWIKQGNVFKSNPIKSN